MPSQTKYIYRDNSTGRLITRREAERRDPSTYTEEQFPGSKAVADEAPRGTIRTESALAPIDTGT